jgi:hypothetical protein
VADLVDAVRNYREPVVADQVVRALASLAHHDTDAGMVLLEALVWALRSRAGGNCSGAFRDEALVELAIVVLEADDLAELDNLPQRLARRAHARVSRRLQVESATRRRELAIGDIELQIPHPDDPADIATDRAHLAATLAVIDRHVESGRLSERAWEDCRDGWLAPSVGWWRIQPDRARTYRGRRAVEAVLAHAS